MARSGRYASGASSSTSRAVVRSSEPPSSRSPTGTATSASDSDAHQLQHQRRQERHPQRPHGGAPVGVGHPLGSTVGLVAGPAEGAQRGQAADHVEEVPAEPGQRRHCRSVTALVCHADQRAEDRDQRQGDQHDDRTGQVGGEQPDEHGDRHHRRPRRSRAGSRSGRRRGRRGRVR